MCLLSSFYMTRKSRNFIMKNRTNAMGGSNYLFLTNSSSFIEISIHWFSIRNMLGWSNSTVVIVVLVYPIPIIISGWLIQSEVSIIPVLHGRCLREKNIGCIFLHWPFHIMTTDWVNKFKYFSNFKFFFDCIFVLYQKWSLFMSTYLADYVTLEILQNVRPFQ